MSSQCPLCNASETAFFHRDRRRDYYQCPRCRLVLTPKKYHPSVEREKAEYDLHRNSPDDPGYRRFLSRLFEPLDAKLGTDAQGLDFGCGPGPTLSVMFEEAGRRVALYDPFYAPERAVLQQRYDFITACEVVEHLHRPGRELRCLWALLKPGGMLGIMTKMVLNREAFAGWHYKNDPTHVCFFSKPTFTWLAAQYRADLQFFYNDVVLLTKTG